MAHASYSTDGDAKLRAPYAPSDDDDAASLNSRSPSELSSGSIFLQRGHVDCIVLASGKILLAHRALLAHRSGVLRDLIIEESPISLIGDDDQPTQVLLPELHAGSARALMYFLYTDILPAGSTTDTSVLKSLLRCSVTYRIPRLQVRTNEHERTNTYVPTHTNEHILTNTI